MQEVIQSALSADYDLVGKYKQDDINGFGEEILNHLVELIEPESAATLLDAMAGDGNLSARIINYCRAQRLPLPHVTVLDYSRVQIEFAEKALPDANCVWGDMLSLKRRDSGELLPLNLYDRVAIKSGNHELPLELQTLLYTNVFKLLKEKGRFINLGFLFEDEKERQEFRKITRIKDSLAGLRNMVKSRHFLTRREFEAALGQAGFRRILHRSPFVYTLRSSVAAEHYFPLERREAFETLLHSAQAKARTMRRNGRIVFERDKSIMFCPGEITVAEKGTELERLFEAYDEYPYDFLRNIEVHRDLLARVVRHIKSTDKVLDLGSGLGLLREKLGQREGEYLGIDAFPDFIKSCAERFKGVPRTAFIEQNVNDLEIVSKGFDVTCLLNVIYQSGINVEKVLRSSFDSLRRGGLLCISGPRRQESFEMIEEAIRTQLVHDGHLPKAEETFRQIVQVNKRLLSGSCTFLEPEEVVKRLKAAGFSEIVEATNEIYYGSGYLVVARK